MHFKRTLLYSEPIELTETSAIDLGLIFKQYDLGTSTLVLDTLFGGEACNFSTEKVYITYKTPTTKYREFVPLTRKEDDSLIVDKGRISRSTPGRLYIDLDEEVLENAGQILGELLIVDETGTQRFTSPTIKFTIEASLSENTKVRTNMVLAGNNIKPNQTVPNTNAYGSKPVDVVVEKPTSFLSERFKSKFNTGGR